MIEHALCPCSLQRPQSLCFLGGGSLKSAVAVVQVAMALELVVMLVVVVVDLVEVVVVCTGGSGTLGMGHVSSLTPSRQNSLILWKRYHCREGASPDGVSRSGRSVAVGVHSPFKRLKSTSGASDLSRAKTCPLLLEENRRWWKDLMPTNFFVCSYRNVCQLYVGTITVPSGVPTSCAVFTLEDVLTTVARLVSYPIFVRLYL